MQLKSTGCSCHPAWVSRRFLPEKSGAKLILDEVDRMPENWQKVAELKLIEGRPTSEVCDQLSISEKACYSRVSRIRKYIKSLLKREDWP